MSDSVLNFSEELKDLQKQINEIPRVNIQSGEWSMSDLGKKKDLDIAQPRSQGERSINKIVKFESPFDHPPKISCGLSMFDAQGADTVARIRVVVDPEKITTHKFNISLETWDKSHVYGFRVEWIAYTVV